MEAAVFAAVPRSSHQCVQWCKLASICLLFAPCSLRSLSLSLSLPRESPKAVIVAALLCLLRLQGATAEETAETAAVIAVTRRSQVRCCLCNHGVRPKFLALKHESRILGHSSNPVCGFSMMEQVRLCAVYPRRNALALP